MHGPKFNSFFSFISKFCWYFPLRINILVHNLGERVGDLDLGYILEPNSPSISVHISLSYIYLSVNLYTFSLLRNLSRVILILLRAEQKIMLFSCLHHAKGRSRCQQRTASWVQTIIDINQKKLFSPAWGRKVYFHTLK